MSVNIDTETLKQLVGENILKALDEQKREALIKSALDYLLTPPSPSGYSTKQPSPLQSAFNDAVTFSCRTIAKEIIEKDVETQAKIRDLIRDAVVMVMEKKREETVVKIADAIAHGMALKNEY